MYLNSENVDNMQCLFNHNISYSSGFQVILQVYSQFPTERFGLPVSKSESIHTQIPILNSSILLLLANISRETVFQAPPNERGPF